MLAKDGIRYLSSPLLSSFKGVMHGFLSKSGGVSGPPFTGLNFDGRSGDTVGNIATNKELVSKAFDLPADRLVLVNQVHGSSVLIAGSAKNNASRPVDADSIVTGTPCVPIGVLTADCLPVFLHDPGKSVIGVAHAGWRGTVAGVAVKTVEAMREKFGSKPEDLISALGPYIGPCCYTVGENVLDEFRGAFRDCQGCFERTGGALRLDLGRANAYQLLRAGLRKENIDTVGLCTSCNGDLFFSYRKDGGMTGRQLSFIMLKK